MPTEGLGQVHLKTAVCGRVIWVMILCNESPGGRGVKKSLSGNWEEYHTDILLSSQKPVIIASCLRKEYTGKKKKCFSKAKKKIATRNISFCVKKGWEPQFCHWSCYGLWSLGLSKRPWVWDWDLLLVNAERQLPHFRLCLPADKPVLISFSLQRKRDLQPFS